MTDRSEQLEVAIRQFFTRLSEDETPEDFYDRLVDSSGGYYADCGTSDLMILVRALLGKETPDSVEKEGRDLSIMRSYYDNLDPAKGPIQPFHKAQLAKAKV